MTIQLQLIQVFLLFCALCSSLAQAADPLMKYRGISHGDTLEQVTQQARSEFPRVQIIDRKFSMDTLMINAGDEQGMQKSFCAYAAPSRQQKNCLSARFLFSGQTQGNRLHIIAVMQSFTPSVTFNSILEKLSTTYGKPRLTFKKSNPANNAQIASTDTVMIWGGNKTPNAPYHPSISGDYEKIGGKFITAAIHHEGEFATGYELNIVESDSALKMFKEMSMVFERERVERLDTNNAAVKF